MLFTMCRNRVATGRPTSAGLYVTVCLLYRIKRKLGGGEVEGVGVMKDEELKLEESETSHTLGGAGSCYAAVIQT